jgi:hypothetical protein
MLSAGTKLSPGGGNCIALAVIGFEKIDEIARNTSKAAILMKTDIKATSIVQRLRPQEELK